MIPLPAPPTGFVYLVRNVVNGRTYVGQTKIGVDRRWKIHVHSSQRKDPRLLHALHRDIRKFGVHNFEVRTLAEVSDLSELNSLERKFAIAHRALYPYGYTQSIGSSPKLVGPRAKARIRRAANIRERQRTRPQPRQRTLWGFSGGLW